MITIYMLVDTRPETIAAGYPDGLPFYCGKTQQNIRDIDRYLRQIAIAEPMRRFSQMLMICEGDFRVEVIQTLTAGQSWKAVRDRWRKWIRDNFPRNESVRRVMPRSHMSGSRRKMIGDGIRRKHRGQTRRMRNLLPPPN